MKCDVGDAIGNLTIAFLSTPAGDPPIAMP